MHATVVRRLGTVHYQSAWQAMRQFTAARSAETADELWLLEHPPVYTLGVAARPQHLPRMDNGIPVVRSDRGGQITYHGPGQVVLYTLLDLARRGLGVRAFVRLLECTVIDFLGQHGIRGSGREDAPGVYVQAAKIAALGLRVRNGRCYHGLALNVAMDLTPFAVIDPCGYPQLAVTSLQTVGVEVSIDAAAEQLRQALEQRLESIKR
jgi:lipoyl(octanoyl) transferase